MINIVITGAGRGIGLSLVKKFSKMKGHRVIAISRNTEAIEKFRDDGLYMKEHSEIVPIAFDLLETDYFPLIQEISNHANSVDILINNAGILVKKPFEEITNEDIYHSFVVNVFSVANLIQALLPIMSRTMRSHIVNIGSMGGFQGAAKFPELSIYSSSKAALACLTECLAVELAERNIAVNCLALGSVQTEMLEEAFPGYHAPVTADEMAAYIADFALNGKNIFNGKGASGFLYHAVESCQTFLSGFNDFGGVVRIEVVGKSPAHQAHQIAHSPVHQLNIKTLD